MTVAILAIGTELTRGEVADTNSGWLAQRLVGLGLEPTEHVRVPDDAGAIGRALTELSGRHDTIVATGGLGPTTDDLTASTVAEVLSCPLVLHEGALDAIRRRFTTLGREMSPSNEKQARLPLGSTMIPNTDGTAPGFAVTLNEARAFFLPGVPREMERMFLESIEPVLAPLGERTTHQIHLRTFGAGESVIGEKLEGIEALHPEITLGYRAVFPEVEVKVLARGDDARTAEARAFEVAREVRSRLGPLVYGEGDETFAAYVGRVLRDRSLRLALAESCTGGLVGQLLTSVPGSSEYVLLDAVTYSNASKIEVLGVNAESIRAYGAVSAEVAVEMVEGALRLSNAHIAAAITGIAGPGGGSEQKPVGTVWLAVGRRDAKVEARRCDFRGSRDRIRTLAAYTLLRWIADTALER